jgi:hypothetical protein
VKVGDLVALRLCREAGKIGIITMASRASNVSMADPGLRLFWVLLDTGNQCFTGNQLIRHQWMEK